MLRRLIAAVFVVVALVASLAPAAVFAAGLAEAHGDCCCPDPELCPIVGGEHLCAWVKRGEKPPAEPPTTAHDGPRLRSCSPADLAAEAATNLVWIAPVALALAPAAERPRRFPAEAPSRSRGADAPEPPPPRIGSFVP